MIHSRYRNCCLFTLGVLLSTGPALAQATPAPRPILRVPIRPVVATPVERVQIITPARADAVVIKAAEPDEVVRALPVRKQLPIANIRANPKVQLGQATLNFKPMLDNPRAPFNVAEKLRAMPQAATVLSEETTAFEIDQGMIVQSKLTYRLQPGVCRDSARSTAVARAGAQCSTRVDDPQLEAVYADRRNPHFVENPNQRGQVIADARSKRAQIRAQIMIDIAELRASLNDPARRSAIDAEVSAAEAARLATLSDDELATEMVNNAENSIEQIIFIPKEEAPPSIGVVKALLSTNGQGKTEQTTTLYNIVKAAGAVQAASGPMVDTTHNLTTRFFLTGFTLGREYEWRQRIEKSIKWCLVGCKKTYFAEIYAGFSYGFGLRFPMQLSGIYRYQSQNGVEKATLLPSYTTINGNAQQYLDAGLPSSQLFDGKELVAEAKAWAGAAYKLPVIGSGGVNFEVGKDFTTGLPAPFTNGQFRPPAPGESGLPAMQKIFDDFDLIGGRANFGVFGGQVFPAVKVELHSDALKFKLRDQVRGTTTIIENSGQAVDLGINPGDKSSRFTLGDPVYSLGFLVTPGLNARVFMDIEVWSNEWNWPIWLPQLAVQLPPGGVDFACHAGTTCVRSYNFSPSRKNEIEGPTSATDAELEEWGLKFDNQWLPQCPDKKCELAIKIVRQGTIFNVKKLTAEKEEASKSSGTFGLPNPAPVLQKDIAILNAYLSAHAQAGSLVDEAKLRVAKGGS